MTPKLIDRIPRERGDAEVWDVSKGYQLLVLPEGETVYVSAHRTRDRAEEEWLNRAIEKVVMNTGFWFEISPSIDTTMVIVRASDITALLRACADYFSSLDEI